MQAICTCHLEKDTELFIQFVKRHEGHVKMSTQNVLLHCTRLIVQTDQSYHKFR